MPFAGTMEILHEKPRERSADNVGDCNAGHKPRDNAPPSFRWVPVCQVENDTRKEAGFSNSEKESKRVETKDIRREVEKFWKGAPWNHVDKCKECRDDSPGDHDA